MILLLPNPFRSIQLRFIPVLYLLLSALPLQLFAQFRGEDYVVKSSIIKELADEGVSFNPIISDNGTSLFVTRSDHRDNLGGELDQDVWMLSYDDGRWNKPSNLIGEINSLEQDLIVGQSQNNMLYSIRYKRGEEVDLTSIKAFRKQGGIFILDHEFNLPNLGIKGNFFGFFVGRDESYVIISMKGDYTFGKEDLYICRKINGQWSEPLHMGARINTAGFEMSPYMSKDERHLFFSSEGHQGFGNGDIYVSTRLDDTWQNWSKPLNLGPNINKAGFEAYFCLNETLNEAYFFSDFEQESGSLYTIPFEPDPSIANPSAHQAASGFIKLKELPAMSVKLNLMDEHDQVIQSITTDEDGYFNLQTFLPDRNYKIAIDDEIREELTEAEIFLTNELGDRMIFMNEDELGIFGFKVLSGERIDEVERFERLAKSGRVVDKPTKISGKVSAFGTISEKVPLKIMNEKNEVVKTIETDDEGYFSFNTDASSKRYFLSIDKDLTGLVDVYEVFLTNGNPNEDIVVSKTDKHLFEFSSLSLGERSGLQLMNETDVSIPERFFETLGMLPQLDDPRIIGYIKLDALPLMDVELELLDESENLIGKARTDIDGKFVFDANLLEGDYQLKLTPDQSEALSKSEIFLSRNPSDVLFYINDNRSGVFAFKKLARNESISLYSLNNETASGKVVNKEVTTLKGRFEYASLPKSGVYLRLMDERDNVVEIAKVSDDGEFEFAHYSTDRNYFIAIEGEGLSGIYEIYLSGQNKNVLVNKTDKYVFAFKVLPTQDVVLTQAFEKDQQMKLPRIPKYMIMGDGIGNQKRSYHEFDLEHLKNSDYLSLHRIIKEYEADYQVVIRLFTNLNADHSSEADLKTLGPSDLEPVIQKLIEWGVEKEGINIKSVVSDQALIILK